MAEVVINTDSGATRADGVFSFEYTVIMETSSTDRHWSMPLTQIQSIGVLTDLYESVLLTDIEVEFNQMTLISPSGLTPNGACFVGIIPSGKDNANFCGSIPATILSVPRKRVCPLSSTIQSAIIHKLDISGFELDLAQDARRQQAPVMWFGNTGVIKTGTIEKTIGGLTWRGHVRCSGTSSLW